MNDTNNTSLSATNNPKTISTALAITIGLLSSTSFLLYFTVWIVICFNYKQFKSTFYLLVMSAGIPDMISLTIPFGYCVPLLVLQKHFNRTVAAVIGIGESFISQLQILHIAAIAMNRLIFCSSKTFLQYHNSIGNKKKTLVVIICIFILATMEVIANIVCLCRWQYSFRKMSWIMVCQNDKQLAKYMDVLVYAIVACFAGLLNIITWIVIKKRQSQVTTLDETTKRKRELKLVLEFSIITSVVLLYATCNILPSDLWSGDFTSFFIAILDILNTTLSPIVYLICDNNLKAAFRKIYKR